MHYITRHGRKVPVEIIGTPFTRIIRDHLGKTPRVVIRIKYKHNGKQSATVLSKIQSENYTPTPTINLRPDPCVL